MNEMNNKKKNESIALSYPIVHAVIIVKWSTRANDMANANTTNKTMSNEDYIHLLRVYFCAFGFCCLYVHNNRFVSLLFFHFFLHCVVVIIPSRTVMPANAAIYDGPAHF